LSLRNRFLSQPYLCLFALRSSRLQQVKTKKGKIFDRTQKFCPKKILLVYLKKKDTYFGLASLI
jgi:hypothetical protein